MTRILLLLLIIPFISCKSQTGEINSQQEAKDPLSVIQENEKKSAEKQNDNLALFRGQAWKNLNQTFLIYITKMKLLLKTPP